ncbi:MAG: hypothetical protein ACO1PB_21280 [Ramlibacter sp.]
MDPRWQPHLGAVQPVQADNLEASGLLAGGWSAQHDECWIAAEGQARRMVSLDTWRALRDRSGFVRARVQTQRG